MNAYLKKEIRLLLPTTAAAFVVAFSTLFLSDVGKYYSGFQSAIAVLPFIVTPALVLMMALDSFGREISSGTFSQLLAQPICREKIWRTKTLLLGAAIFLVWLTWWSCYVGNKNIAMKPGEMGDAFMTAALVALVILSGGLWTVLLLRQVAAAFWFTLLIPAGLALVTSEIARRFSFSGETALISVLGIYSIAGFIFARWLFLRAQDVQWTGGVIALPEIASFGKTKTPAARRLRSPRLALIFKELQLHQSQLVMAGVLLLFHLAVVFMRKFVGTLGSPTLEFIYQTFWVLWFVMPLLIGCAAVAEERKLGTLENQLCLPARRRTQFWIKFLFALALSLILAVAVPLLVEGSRIVFDFHPKFLERLSRFFLERGGMFDAAIGSLFGFLHTSMPILILLGIATVIAVVSFYASTLSRNTLQSLAPAVLGIILAVIMLIGASDVGKFLPFAPWRGWLIYLIGVPVLTVMLLWLMSWNFKRVLVNGKVWRRNALVIVASFAFVVGATSAVYHRAWEFLIPTESAHGTARLKPSNAVKLESSSDAITIEFADGRVWSGYFDPFEQSLATSLSGNWKMKPMFGGGKFLEKTNWASVSISYQGMIGIQKDGSLWGSERPRRNFKEQPGKLVRLGNDSDWKAVEGDYLYAFFLKKDGTLWHFNSEGGKKPWPGIQAFEIQRLGTDSDWAEISHMNGSAVFRKTDGRTFINVASSDTGVPTIRFENGIFIARAESLDGIESSIRISSRSGFFGEVGVGQDGNFYLADHRQWVGRGRFILKSSTARIQLGNESDWLAVAGGYAIAVTLRADGSLWKWNFTDVFGKPESAPTARLGKYSDWVAIADRFEGVLSLAADGSIWLWQFEPHDFYVSRDEKIPALLSASRKPQKIANIFDPPKVP